MRARYCVQRSTMVTCSLWPGVIARLDRAIQYSLRQTPETRRLRVLDPRFRGDDSSFLLHARQHFELAERRRRRQRPFQRGGARPPWIGAGRLLAREGVDQAPEEDQDAEAGDVGADRGHQIPAREGIGIVDIAARHAGETEE